MSNKLIIEAYKRQVEMDVSRGPYYLRCLETIGHWRGDLGLSIAQAVSLEYSKDRYTDLDLCDAYRYFQLDINNKSLTEDEILGRFFARISDSRDDAEARRQLWRIGDYLGSEKIKAVVQERTCSFWIKSFGTY